MFGKYIPPTFAQDNFHCPFCGVYAHQRWDHRVVSRNLEEMVVDLSISECAHCKSFAFWFKESLIMPDRGTAPQPSPEMPVEVSQDYEEAASILAKSPRGAAALLRLAVQKLCVNLGKSGENLNSDIAEMVAEGLKVEIQQALDVIRVVGNNAVHPGVLDLKDDVATCDALFNLLNLIVEDRIAQPKRVGDLFSQLPQSSRDAIEKRDDQTPK